MNDTIQPAGQHPLLRHVQGLMLGRVVMITFLWLALVSVEGTGEPTRAHLPLTYIILITYGLTIAYGLYLRQHRHLECFYLLQVCVDLCIETTILQSTGGLDSGFAFLYILSIISAGIALPGRPIFGVAAGASVLYGLLVYLNFSGIIHPLPFPFTAKTDTALSGAYAAYSTLLTVTAFWVVALLCRFLAESLRHTGRVLQEQTAHLVGLRAFHANVVNSMNSGLLITDLRGRIVSANMAAARLLMHSPGTLRCRSAQEVFPFLDLAEILQQTETLDERLNRAEGLYERPDGQKIILGISYSPLHDEKGTVHGLVFNFRDLTAIRAMELEMKRGEQLAAVGRLSAAITHEIRNPLASISGSIQLLRSGLALDAANQRLMDIVEREVERLNAIITDFLAYARPRPIEYAEVDIHKLITGTLDLLRHGLPASSAVTIRTQLHAAVSSTRSDPQGLRQVIWNLCLNAVEAMQYQGTLTVRTAVQPLRPYAQWSHDMASTASQEFIIAVTDTGPGIPPEAQQKIFEPFYSTKDGGSGLGLATVDRIVYNFGGKIELDSQAGQGTTMRIRLPLVPSTTDACGPQHAS